MLTYNMDVEERSTWLRATPGAAAQAQPFYCTEAGNFYGRAHFATARTDKESYLLFYTLSGSGLIEQNDQRIELPAGSALLLNCRTPQSYCTAPGQDHWHHYWVHLDGAAVKVTGLGAVKGLRHGSGAGGGPQPDAALLHVHVTSQHRLFLLPL